MVDGGGAPVAPGASDFSGPVLGRKFVRFCEHLRIDSKELGLVPLRLWGTQRHVVNEINAGLEDDVHHFVVLKGRQQGITTIMLAVDLFWLMRHPGVQGSLVSDTDENRDQFRAILTDYHKHLPGAFKRPLRAHNRNLMAFESRSRLFYQVAGTRRKGGLGRGKGLVFMHGTETSSWADQEGLMSLRASFAEKNRRRLFVFESTARGYNMFHDMWIEAKKSHERGGSQRAIFAGWWLKEINRIPKGETLYNIYWDGRPTSEELEWMDAVRRLYGREIDDEQLAWWRWQREEEIGDETALLQEHPPTEMHGFQLSGSTFFSAAALSRAAQGARGKRYKSYRFVTGAHFHEMELHETTEPNAELKVWREVEPGATYVIGADPAYGSSDWKDRYCLSVWRAYADGMEQVAEYCTPDCSTYAFAWIIAYLAGYYRNAMVMLEITGPGTMVFQELQRLQQMANGVADRKVRAGIFDLLGNMRHYLYHRPDSMGAQFAYHWKSSQETKSWMMNAQRDALSRGQLDCSSLDYLEEAKTVEMSDGFIGAPGRKKDDRVIAAGLAVKAWYDTLLPELMARQVTRNKVEAERREGGTIHPTQHVIAEHLQRILGQRRDTAA